MARLGLATAGAVAGFAIGGPLGAGLLGAQLGFAAGSIAGNILFPPPGQTHEGPRLNDLTVTSSAYGRPIPIGYGRMRYGGNVVWSPGIKERRNEEEVGGKGGQTQTTVSYSYTADFRAVLCEGPAAAVLKIWADGKLIADFTGSGPIFTTKVSRGNIRINLGAESQLPDPAEQADKGIANAPAYRGLVSLVFDDMPLEDFGNRIPQVTAEVAFAASETFPTATLTPTGPGLLYAELQPGGRTYINHGGDGEVTRIDLVGQRELITADLPDFNNPVTNFPAIDGEGNFYNATETGLNQWHLRRYDGTTFAQIGDEVLMRDPVTGSPIVSSVGWDEDRVFGGNILADGTVGSELLFLSESGGSSEVVAASTDTLEVIAHYFLATGLSKGMAVDAERHLWVHTANNGGDIELYRIDPVLGTVAASHTIAGETGGLITYEASTNALVIGNGATLLRWSIDTQTIEARLDGISYEAGNRNEAAFWNGPSAAGRLYLQDAANGDFTEYDVVNMVVVRNWQNSEFGLSGDVEFALYDPVHHAVIGRNVITGQLVWRFLDRKTGGDVTLRSIVEDVSARVGLTVGADIDATALTDTFPGYVVDRRMAARRALEPLASAFFFRSVETDFQVKFPKRGGASVFAVPEEDLGAHAGHGGEIALLAETIEQEVDLPEVLDLVYADPKADYQAMTQGAKRSREVVNTRRRASLNFPGALDNGAAARIVEKMLFLEWLARKPVDFTLSWQYARLDPADVGSVTADGVTRTVELDNTDFGADGVIRLRAIPEDGEVHASAATGSDAVGVPAQAVTLAGPSALHLLDTPLLRDQDEGLGIYVAAGAFGDESWPGASVYRSNDGIDFGPLTFVPSSRNAGHGYAAAALADGPTRIWDRSNSVTLRLFRGSLASDTELNVLNGANALLLGDEVVQFAGATLNADGSYTLSTLLRGRRGTEWATATHVLGERVVVLSASTLLKVPLDSVDLNISRFYKAVTVGGSLAEAERKTLKLLGRAMMPLSPADIRGARDGSPSDWIVTWKRRTRVGGAWRDGVDVPLSEESEAYEVDIIAAGSPDVARSITAAVSAGGSVVIPGNRQAVYSDADQIADFGAVQGVLTVKVYQLSALVGRGFAGAATLAP